MREFDRDRRDGHPPPPPVIKIFADEIDSLGWAIVLYRRPLNSGDAREDIADDGSEINDRFQFKFSTF
jgi:hypothetical protein